MGLVATYCPDCGAPAIEDCECALCNSDCIEVDGKGDSSRPFSFAPTFDPDEDNLASSSSSGLLAELPSYVLNPPRCHIYASANQSNPNDDDIIMAFNSERYDSDSMHDTVTDNDLVVFNTAGIYHVTFNCTFAAAAGGDRKAAIYRNGIYPIGLVSTNVVGGSITIGLSLNIQETFEVGDTIRVRTRQDSGSALNVLATRYSPILAVQFLRPLPPT